MPDRSHARREPEHQMTKGPGTCASLPSISQCHSHAPCSEPDRAIRRRLDGFALRQALVDCDSVWLDHVKRSDVNEPAPTRQAMADLPIEGALQASAAAIFGDRGPWTGTA